MALDVVYLYGSSRDASTKALRRTVFPREKVIRLGPWIIRPARRLAVPFLKLLPFVSELIEKVERGSVQVQRADTTTISIADLKAAVSEANPNFMGMPYAELRAMMRTSSPDPKAWQAFSHRTIQGEGGHTKEVAKQMLRQFAAELRKNGGKIDDVDAPVEVKGVDAAGAPAAEVVVPKEPPAQEPTRIDRLELPQTPAGAVSAAEPPPSPVEASSPPEAASLTADDGVQAAAVEETVVEVPSRESMLPENWATFTAKDLLALCNEKGIPFTKTSKSALVTSIQTWVQGGS